MRHPRREVLVILLVALGSGLATTLPPFGHVRGWSIDILTTLRWEWFGPRQAVGGSRAVVIAIDEETYQSPPFQGSPTPIWTTEIGRVLTAVLDGGAKVVGFDIVFANSIEQSALPFGEDSVGAKLRGFDRPFLRALAAGAAAGKVVLGEVLRSEGTIAPSAGQSIAVRRA